MRSPRVRRARLIGLLGVALLAAGLGVLGYATHALRSLDLSTVDTRFSIRGTQPRPDDIVVVGIDDKTFGALREQWPFPRHIHAQLIDRLREDGARAIAYDVQFTERTDRRDDEALVLAVERAERRRPLDHRSQRPRRKRHLRRRRNRQGGRRPRRRHRNPERRRTASCAASLSKSAALPHSRSRLSKRRARTVDLGGAGGPLPWIDYRGPPKTFENVSFSDALRGRVPASTFRGKIVLVGATSPSLQDYHATPTSGEEEMPGVEVQANAIWTVEHGFPLQSVPGWLNLALIVLFGMLAPAAQLRLRPLLAFGLALAVGLFFVVGAQLVFNGGWIVSVAYPLASLAISATGALVVVTLITAYERQQVRDTFARFVPETVVDDVLERADENLRLAGVRREGTVLFSDLRGFTSFAEALPPDQVIEVLNHYLSEMSDAIMDHGGTLVSYMGDGIMAVFGAPIEQPDHADRAVAAAPEMLGMRLGRFNEWIAARASARASRWGSGSTAAASCRARSARSGGSNTQRSATRRTLRRASRE